MFDEGTFHRVFAGNARLVLNQFLYNGEIAVDESGALKAFTTVQLPLSPTLSGLAVPLTVVLSVPVNDSYTVGFDACALGVLKGEKQASNKKKANPLQVSLFIIL